ncbi:glycoside hydrolase family 18 [Fusarium pseudoanthophilum]|uniref:Glycoside hydrolase family 18 n=1 Tax=Fusarium pseudoanthophilum TaxID=48495 RepID=A0A8H5KGM7_9HYPO|nr:glycoside hydrolase family 18 [Fusarium pseudoanthophilum]
MSTVKLLFDVGTSFIAPGRALGAGAEMILYAVDLINYVYPADEDPAGAFEWWLSPCGGSDLVPDDIKEVFDWLSAIPTGRSRFKPPKKIKKGSGKKGDAGNPRSAPGPQKPPTGTGSGSNPKPKKKKCKVSPKQATQRLGGGKNTLRLVGCDPNDVKTTTNLVVTTLTSAQSNNPHWSTLDCPQAAATNSYRNDAAATATWNLEHKGSGWTDAANYKVACDRDEFPPAYLLAETDDAFTEAGKSRKGQRLRFIPGPDNRRAGSMWKGVCFASPLEDLSLKSFHDLVTGGTRGPMGQAGNTRSGQVAAVIQSRPRFEIAYEIDDPKVQTTPKLKDDGLWDNACWPKHMAKTDPGFVLLSLDEWYDKNPKPVWDYTQAYKKG